VISEEVAALIFWRAIKAHRAAELLDHLFEGGGVTVDPRTGDLIMIPASDIDKLARGDHDDG
jgi:hypothetical protein